MFLEFCPVSGFFAVIVTMPFDAMLINELGTNAGAAPRPGCAKAATFGYKPSIIPPPAKAVTRRKERRLIFILFTGPPYFLPLLRGNRFAPSPAAFAAGLFAGLVLLEAVNSAAL